METDGTSTTLFLQEKSLATAKNVNKVNWLENCALTCNCGSEFSEKGQWGWEAKLLCEESGMSGLYTDPQPE